MDAKALQHYHNKAEQDFKAGKYQDPHWFPITDQAVAESKAYDKGWKNAKEQPKK